MSKCIEQVKEFLEKCNVKMEIEYIGRGTNEEWDVGVECDMYRFTITTPRGAMADIYHMNAHETKRGTPPTEVDILAALEKREHGTIENFVENYGYEDEIHNWADMKRIVRLYRIAMWQYKELHRVFTSEQVDTLYEIL